jgi:hypothetical protein
MADPNLIDFYGRIARIETARSKGFGFEDPGTLGRSHYYLPPKKRRSLLAPTLFLALAVIGLKGMILYSVGADSYNDRVASMLSREGFDRLGGWMMQADPVTVLAAQQIGVVVSKFE